MIKYNGIKGSNYFEGWFFRVYAPGFNCALIPSISVTKGQKKAFIQYNCNEISETLEFDFSTFSADDYQVIIGGNKFSDQGICFSAKNLSIDVEFNKFTQIKKDIMGCFKFGTPCKHKIISMKHFANGKCRFFDKEIELKNANAYIEKDWGKSFPKAYCWLQSNDFENQNVSFFFSVAKIGFPFLGLICVLLIDGKEYRFATYNFSTIKKLEHGYIEIKKFNFTLYINFTQINSKPLYAPKMGGMSTIIKECLNGKINLTLKKNKSIIFEGKGRNAGVEWVNF